MGSYIRTLVQHLSSTLQARNHCQKTGNLLWENRHNDRINSLEKNHLPSGSGIDRGVKFLDVESRSDRLVFEFGFHHMDQHGYYDGWTDHKAVVTPAFDGINVHITGINRNQIKDYLHELFYTAMLQKLESLDDDSYVLVKTP